MRVYIIIKSNMDLDDEIMELIFNDYRIDKESLNEFSITDNYAQFKKAVHTTSLGIEATVIYEVENAGHIQRSEMEAFKGNED